MSALLTPQEFDEIWAQVSPEVSTIIEDAIQRSPLASPMDGKARAARYLCVTQAFTDILDLLPAFGLQMFDTIPDSAGLESDAQALLALARRLARYKSCDDEALKVDSYSGSMELLRINAPAWFENPDFFRWLTHKGTATWHQGEEPNEFSDVFFTFCQGEGSDYPSIPDRPGIPEEIWRYLEILVAEKYGWNEEVLVWVSNLA